jgi:hypothetical protein
MAKARKLRRAKKGKRARLSAAQLVQPGMAAEGGIPGVAAGSPEELREEYGYVAADVKRAGIIAAGLVVVLVALAFVLV